MMTISRIAVTGCVSFTICFIVYLFFSTLGDMQLTNYSPANSKPTELSFTKGMDSIFATKASKEEHAIEKVTQKPKTKKVAPVEPITKKVIPVAHTTETFDHLAWTPLKFQDDIQGRDQNDPELHKYIRDNWLLPPFSGLDRKLENKTRLHYSQRKQSFIIDRLLKQRKNGFFIECGAATGESFSNSLFFEKSRNWTGVLIEANPENFKLILKKRRRAHMLNVCLSPYAEPSVLEFQTAHFIGSLLPTIDKALKDRIERLHPGHDVLKIQCFPTAAILQAIGVKHVDYFSLDVEGAEVGVLEHFPFDKITVDVMSIEYKIGGDRKGSHEKLKKIQTLLGRYGYRTVFVDDNEDVIVYRD